MYERFQAVERDGKYYAPDGREAFPFTCPGCGETFYAAQSWLMKWGINSGHAECSCGLFLHLELAPAGDRMLAEDWLVYRARELAPQPGGIIDTP